MFDFSLDPFIQFEAQLAAAQKRGEPEHNAMALATVGADNKTSVRIVYFKGIIRGGLSFYCNYDSTKGQNIAHNNNVCVNFYYPTEWQQMRISGKAEKLTRAESEAYFKTRNRLSQIGAWASNQSQEIPNTETFQRKVQEFEKSFEGQEIPCPQNWGGYHIIPEEFEFWFGKNGRLHERYVYQITKSGWHRMMKSP